MSSIIVHPHIRPPLPALDLSAIPLYRLHPLLHRNPPEWYRIIARLHAYAGSTHTHNGSAALPAPSFPSTAPPATSPTVGHP